MSAPVKLCFGMRGYGKTTIARELVAEEPRVLAYDPFGEHAAVRVTLDQAVEYFTELEESDNLGAFRVSVYPYQGDERVGFAALAWAVARRCESMVLVLEEADEILPATGAPGEARRLVSQGRHVNMAIVGTSRRPAEVARLLTSNADEYFIFRTQEPGDLTYLRSIIGADATARVAELPKFHYVYWTPEGWEERETTVASSASPRAAMGPGESGEAD